MRKLASLALAAVFAAGSAFVPAPAEARDRVRIYVDLGDVLFSAGRPYYRHTRAPLYVAHGPYGPRYYHYAPPPPPVVVYRAPPPRYYAPPPPRYWHGDYRRSHAKHHHHHHRNDHRGRGHGHGRGHDRRGWR
ncbi:hypothetical protein [Coralloluteibacterium thermophilus]|uniref:Uncharacterized protein n=1 Tax=Coralloluteibacterium thermophilum TaxID=2707049 RepID=A0ABV9NG23_9GAMM